MPRHSGSSGILSCPLRRPGGTVDSSTAPIVTIRCGAAGRTETLRASARNARAADVQLFAYVVDRFSRSSPISSCGAARAVGDAGRSAAPVARVLDTGHRRFTGTVSVVGQAISPCALSARAEQRRACARSGSRREGGWKRKRHGRAGIWQPDPSFASRGNEDARGGGRVSSVGKYGETRGTVPESPVGR